ncbi:hypothetical protein EDD85DRAFT_232824 [Armillaria nabsnona]|nr:hypothetical protein EDD85DRAFT_232824 [Armillaria nabsnona]
MLDAKRRLCVKSSFRLLTMPCGGSQRQTYQSEPTSGGDREESSKRRKARLRRRGLVGEPEAQAMNVEYGEPEPVKRANEREEADNLVDPAIKANTRASWSGLYAYDLVVTVMHKGTAAGSGHYIGFAMKSVFHGASYSGAPVADMDIHALDAIEADADWYKFDDDKVSVFPRDTLGALDGSSGEDSSAYVLVYQSRYE